VVKGLMVIRMPLTIGVIVFIWGVDKKMFIKSLYLTYVKYTDAFKKYYLLYLKYKILVKYMRCVKYSIGSGGFFV